MHDLKIHKPAHVYVSDSVLYLVAKTRNDYSDMYYSKSSIAGWGLLIVKLMAGQIAHAADRMTSKAQEENGDVHFFMSPITLDKRKTITGANRDRPSR